MSKYKGRDFLVQLWDGSNFNTIANSRQCSFQRAVPSIDISKTRHDGWTHSKPSGKKSVQMTLSGLVTDDAGQMALEKLVYAQTKAIFRILSGRTDYYQGVFLVKSFSRTAPHSGSEDFQAILSSSGEIAYTAPVPPDDGPFRITDVDLYVRATDDGADRIYE